MATGKGQSSACWSSCFWRIFTISDYSEPSENTVSAHPFQPPPQSNFQLNGGEKKRALLFGVGLKMVVMIIRAQRTLAEIFIYKQTLWNWGRNTSKDVLKAPALLSSPGCRIAGAAVHSPAPLTSSPLGRAQGLCSATSRSANRAEQKNPFAAGLRTGSEGRGRLLAVCREPHGHVTQWPCPLLYPFSRAQIPSASQSGLGLLRPDGCYQSPGTSQRSSNQEPFRCH